MLSTYLDESGYEAKDRLVIGGFLGNDDQWAEFGAAWREGLGKRKRLHMKSLRWKSDNTRRLLQRLGPIPYKHGLVPCWVEVKVSDFSDLIDETILSHKSGHGYVIGAEVLSLAIVVYAWSLEETVKVVFENNERFATTVPTLLSIMNVFPGFKTPDGRPCLSGVEFVSKDRTSRTEPGDYIAYAVLQRGRDSKSTKAKWCSSILRDVPSINPQLTREITRHVLSSPTWDEIRKLGREMEPVLQRIRAARKAGKQL